MLFLKTVKTNLLRYLILTFLLLATLPSQATRKAMIFRGQGVCDGCAESVGILLISKGWQVKYVTERGLTPDNFRDTQMYIQPGGDDDIESTMKSLAPADVAQLRQFVKKGGIYLGICAGAYLAGTFADDDESVPAFSLMPSEAQMEYSSDKPAVVPIVTSQGRRWVYYQSGPNFPEPKDKNIKVWARYQKSGHPAALISNYGHGRVGVIGPHFEASKDWYEDEGLHDPDRLDFDLFFQFLEQLTNTKT